MQIKNDENCGPAPDKRMRHKAGGKEPAAAHQNRCDAARSRVLSSRILSSVLSFTAHGLEPGSRDIPIFLFLGNLRLKSISIAEETNEQR